PRDGGVFLRKRVAQLAVGRDREANEPAGLVARVEDGDVVAEQRELARARETRGAGAAHGHATASARPEPREAGAEHGDALAGARTALRKAHHAHERVISGVALQAADRDRPSRLVRK